MPSGVEPAGHAPELLEDPGKPAPLPADPVQEVAAGTLTAVSAEIPMFMISPRV